MLGNIFDMMVGVVEFVAAMGILAVVFFILVSVLMVALGAK